jgi:SNF2 family DNA or RNA helicase
MPWLAVILDEAQNIKNPSAKQTQAVRKVQSEFRVALTGTPVENRLSELWSIMQFLNPGYLGTREKFRSNFALPIERYQDEQALKQLKQMVNPFILRRVKTDPTVISDLPAKVETKVYCTLTEEQATLYEAVVKDVMRKIEEKEGIERRGLVLSMLMQLKQICNHPVQYLHQTGKNATDSALDGRSGKLERLQELLEEVLAEGDRALIFTQFAEMGALLAAYLPKSTGASTQFLYGGTPVKMRDQMVSRFQEDEHAPPIFILSIKAGGTGLNLTRANHVFHFDRWWNPAVEDQATDRAFRIGQKRNVQVHKFVTTGTLEEMIDDMIESKKGLAQAVVGSGENWLTELSTDELRNLVMLRRQ